MNQKDFDELFKKNKMEYKLALVKLYDQMYELKRKFNESNAALDALRRKTYFSNEKKIRKHECYALQHYLGGLLGSWTKTRQIDAASAVVHFDCCSDEKAVFTIEIPYFKQQPDQPREEHPEERKEE